MSAKHKSIRISRRRFLTGTAMAAGGVASLTLLAACVPAAPVEPTAGPSIEPTKAPTPLEAIPDNLVGKTGPAQSGGILNLAGALMTQPHLSPLRTPGGSINGLMGIMGEMLVYRHWDGVGLDYGMAESHEEIEKDRVFEFKLRQNAKWHDGHPFTADDVVYTFYLLAHRDVATQFPLTEIKGVKDLQENGGGIEKLTGVTKIDDYTVRFELEEPTWNWLFMRLAATGMNYNILPAHILSQVPPDQVYDLTTQMPPIPLSGPFKFKQMVQDQYVELERHDDYHLGKPYMDGIIFRFLSGDAIEAAAEVGDVDMCNVSNAESGLRLGALPHLDVVPFMSTDIEGVHLNDNRFGEFHTALQQAMVLALDRETVVTDISPATKKLTDYIWDAVAWWQPPPEGLKTYPYDPEQARDILEQAGWDFDREIKWYAWYPPTPVYSFMMQQWNDIGLKVIWDQTDRSQVVDRLYANPDYDMYVTTVAFRHDPTAFESSFKCDATYESGAGWNTRGYCDPKVDAYFEEVRQAAAEGGLEAMKPVVQEFAKYWNEVLPTNVLWRQGSLNLYNKRVNSIFPIYNPGAAYALAHLEKMWLSS